MSLLIHVLSPVPGRQDYDLDRATRALVIKKKAGNYLCLYSLGAVPIQTLHNQRIVRTATFFPGYYASFYAKRHWVTILSPP